MTVSRTVLKPATFGAVLVVLTTVGCGKNSYQVAEVDGVLIIHGAPGHKVLIQFIPDVDMGNNGPIAVAETDANGRFTLQLKETSGTVCGSGALVGWHKVVLSDLQLAQSETGRGVLIRLAARYTLPGSTPLAQEVQPGKQTIEIRIP